MNEECACGLYGFGMWGSLLSGVIGLLVILMIAWLVFRLVEKREEKGGAIEILKQRYAKGELSRKEFEEKKSDLMEKL